ncbi:hypothetical protein [Halorubrum halodurans]|uniref:hypothetical protein n=1 Tax=Halorubrum halodurans TaxID=1383851 RepID=UPI001179AB7B|nr:hypothetical protein [Halorubrum halodurans]
MADYSTLLQTWGDTGEAYPTGYSVLEGEQPVDAWENFAKYNIIEDLKHLISLTNERIETDKGTAGSEPSTPDPSHLFHDTDSEALKLWDGTAGSWHRLLAADGDTLEGALNFDGKAAQNVGPLNMAATADLDGNDLVDGAATVWDATAGEVPLSALANDSVTVAAGSGLSGGGSVSLGGLVTLDVSDGSGSGLDADTVDGFHAEDLGMNIEEDGSLAVSSSTGIDFTGHLNVIDDGDGTVTIDPTHNHDGRYYTQSEVRNWVNGNADVPNADYADSAGNADTLDGNHASSFASSGHTHDGRYYTKSQTRSWVNNSADVPNADYADNAGNADTVDGFDASQLTGPDVSYINDPDLFGSYVTNDPNGKFPIKTGFDPISSVRNISGTVRLEAGGNNDRLQADLQEVQIRNAETGNWETIDTINDTVFCYDDEIKTRSFSGLSGGAITNEIRVKGGIVNNDYEGEVTLSAGGEIKVVL